MTNFDDYFVGDEVIKKKNYKEFHLPKEDEDSLKDIEKTLHAGKINSSNKSMYLDFLYKLYVKVQMIKKNEYEYEGENNLNVNIYVDRIQSLIRKINEV
ncbi:MAG: hypothetical protein ACP5NV_05145 [Candidatus Woesearchaeota archaeon]